MRYGVCWSVDLVEGFGIVVLWCSRVINSVVDFISLLGIYC